MVRTCLAALVLLASGFNALAQENPPVPAPLEGVGFDQRLNEQVPLDLTFTDETGRSVQLKDYFGKRPVILVLAYYRCPRLCTLVLNGLVQGMQEIPFELGKDFEVVTVSFDPRDTWQQAAKKKANYVRRYGAQEAETGWHFLTGQPKAIQQLTRSVGFRYRYDPEQDQFIHASGIVVLTPEGKISRYFYDIKFPGRDLRLGLVDAGEHQIGSPVDQILLYCLHYDASLGKYTASIMNMVRLGGILTLIAVGIMVWFFERTRRRIQANRALPQSEGTAESWTSGETSQASLPVGERRPS